MRQQFKLSALSAAILASMMSTPLYAAEEETEEKAKAENEIEVIEVQGFRGSLKRAINAKRFSESVSDSISAEDVGKSTDQNIADALSRVTGVTVQEEAGEGTRISVRGAGPSLNQISMNGVALTGGMSTDGSNADATNDNSVDLSAFSSSVLSSIDVIKTASADQDEGSLGANVVLRTVKPLELNRPRRSFTVEGRYNEFADENDAHLNFSIADKFFDDTFGFVLTASKDEQKTRTDRINTNWEAGAIAISDISSNNVNSRPAHDVATGKPIRVLGYQRDADGNMILGDNGQPLLNPIESLVDYDPETQILHEGDLYVLARDSINMSLSTDERERFTITSGLQFRPTDDLDIQLDITHTEQDIYTDYHGLNMNISPAQPLIHPDDDNLALNAVDLTNNTLVKSSSRAITGGLLRSSGLREVDSDVASLKFDYIISDNLTMDLMLGYSRTTDETPDQDSKDRYVSMNTATWGTAGAEVVYEMPDAALEMVGYDCSSGSSCSYLTGETPAVFDAYDGSANLVTSRFNPLDLQHNHLSRFVFRNNKLEDTSKSVFLDFDYELDNEYVRSFEFGAKYTTRTKDVHVQNLIIENADADALESLGDSDVPFETSGMGTISVMDILADEQFPYDNFADDIQGDRSNPLFFGWPLLDSDKALAAFTGLDDVTSIGAREDINGSREIETETTAAYFKTNFELMDGKLTGNIGIRYIKDKNTATGVGGIQYPSHFRFLDAYNLLEERDLANMALEPCPAPIQAVVPGDSGHKYAPENAADLQNCWAWQITHAYNKNNSATLPYDPVTGTWLVPGADGQVGPDVNLVAYRDPQTGELVTNPLPAQIYDQNGNLVSLTERDWLHFHADGHIWPFWDLSTANTNPLYAQYGTQMYNRTAMVTQSNINELWLPSLNLNYAINDEMIGRFAVSKTMTRPRFDSLNPRVQVQEQSFGSATGSAGNANLKPLESNNVDVSWEWYFNEQSLLSVALFYKDMTNFEETANIPYHYRDVRTQYDLESADLLLPFDENREVGDAEDCHPNRHYGGFIDEWIIECDVANVNTVKNGKGATIQGLEFGYTQNYDFLPGLLSGFGLSFNYTYQDSESDPEVLDGITLKSLPQPYTPKHSANTTLFWEQNGTQFRLAHRFTDDQLVSRGLVGGATWQEETVRLDFSSNIKITDNLSLTLHALNLTDDTRRIYYTSANTRAANNANSSEIVLDEGNALDDSNVTESRTASIFKTGRQFRIGIRGTF
ncbi:TonB-dependent receptor domain-containing protein [Thalassotalea mangrovi]|uniref:TonB-dependent receptor n=1 Tax=Thalassotalea mangrovi TaxID=2572245 RepID=A0A4U1B274_9GAMM|nr:TonB-dependent receptor [Thalassotalea mangrovi]TKB43677.1 TonB-dependent receptor [Thalassotalea mangrovi]